MTLLRLLCLALILGATILAIVQTYSTVLPAWKKAAFISLRLLAGTLIILAFTEPSFTVNWLPERNRPLPVLVDASRSMSLFSVDSVLQHFRAALNKLDSNRLSNRRTLRWFLFGDSLRRHDGNAAFTFNDRRSFFPSMIGDPFLQKATELIVISDANWSNSAPVFSNGKAIWYLPLAPPRLSPAISVSLPDTITAAAKKPRPVKIPCWGRASDATIIAIEITEDSSKILADSVTAGPGPFSHTFEALLPAASAGLHLYRVRVANRIDSVEQSCYLVYHAVAQTFNYTMISSRQSLDLRFFRLAIARRSMLIETAPSSERHDAVFFFGDGGGNEAGLTSGALAVYIGSVPGKTAGVDSIAGARLFLPRCSAINPFLHLPLRDLPPITSIARNPRITPACPWLSAQIGNDTIPLLFNGFYRNLPIVVCAFSGFWKWDFLPLSHTTGEAEAFAFSNLLVDAIIEKLHTMKTDTLLVFPCGQPTEIDSLRLCCCIPHSARLAETIRIPCTISKENSVFRYDTLLDFSPSFPLIGKVTLPPLDSGRYSVRCSLSSATKTMRSAVEFEIEADKSELLVSAQNETLLREIGQPLDITSEDQLAGLLHPSEGNPIDQTVRKRVVIKRSWGILIALLLLLGVEWLMRRLAELD